jgi:hypothetical protein
MFREAGKQSANIDLAYRQCSLRCLSDLVQFTSAKFKDVYFETYWSTVFLKYFDQDLAALHTKDQQRLEQQIEQFKSKNRRKGDEMVVDNAVVEDTEMLQGDDDKAENVDSESKMQVNGGSGDDDKTNNESEAKKTVVDEKTDEEKEQEAANAELKLILLETIGKCWPFSWEIQGILIIMFYNVTTLLINHYFFLIYVLNLIKRNISSISVY